MANSVDNRVVEMTFNNENFEKKLSATIASLDRLNTTIASAGKGGLSGLQASADKFNMHGVTSAVENVSTKFIALAATVATVFARMTNTAIDAGTGIVKAFALDPVLDGFKEYELNINSIQTILANTAKSGTDLGDVNAALDELNEYSDLTIYNFAQMTKNIGSATAAGVDLDTAVSYVKGFANSAAIAGVDAGSMAGALEQMSQALGSGVIKLQDWISLEKRGLAGQVQQEAFFEVAKAAGTLADVPLDKSFKEWQAEGNTLRSSLADGWLTTEVFNDTMKVFTGELSEAELAAMGFSEAAIPEMIKLGQLGVDSATKVRTLTQVMDVLKESVASGWSASFRTIVGDFEQASDTFTLLSDTLTGFVGKNAEARNAVLTDWAEMGGRAEVIEGIRLTFVNLGKILAPIQKAFRNVFPRKTGEDLYNMSVRFKEFAASLEPGRYTVMAIGAAFNSFFRIVKSLGSIVLTIAKGFGILFKELWPFQRGQLLGETNKGLDALADALESINQESILDFFRNLAVEIKKLPERFEALKDRVVEFFDGLNIGNFGDKVKDFFDFDLPSLPNIDLPDIAIVSRFEKVFEGFSKIGDTLQAEYDRIAPLLTQIYDAISGFWKDVGGDAAAVVGSSAFDEATDVVAVGLLAGIGLAIKNVLKGGLKIDFDLGGGFFKNLTGIFNQLTGVLSAMQTELKASALQKIAIAIGILTASVIALSFVDSDSLAKALTAMAVGFGQLIIAFEALGKISSNPISGVKLIGIAAGLTVLAGALLVMSFAVRSMSNLGWEELARGLLGVTTVLGVMVLAVQPLASQTGQITQAAFGILVLSGALVVMAAAMKIFATLSWEEIGKGFTGLVGGLLAIGVAMKLFPTDVGAKTAGLLGLAGAILILSVAMKLLGTMSLEEIGKGLLGITVALIGMGVALQLMDKANMTAKATQLLAVGGAMILIASAIRSMAQLSWEELGRGLLGITGALLVLGITSKALESGLKGAGGLLVMSLSLKDLIKILKQFADIPMGTIVSGLTKLGIVLLSIAGLSYALSAAVVPMAGIGLALLALGAGLALIGVGAHQFAKAFAIIIAAGEQGIALIDDIAIAIGRSIPAIAQGLAVGLLAAAEAFLSGFAPILGLVGEVIVQILGTVTNLIPEFQGVLVAFVEAGLNALITLYPKLVEAGITMIMALLQGIRDNITQVVTVALEIVAGLLQGLVEGFPTMIEALVEALTTVLTTVAEATGKLATTLGPDIGIAFLTGLIAGLDQTTRKLLQFAKDLFNGFIKWIKNLLGISSPSKVFKQIGVFVIQGFVNGMKDTIGLVRTFAVELPKKILGWLGNALLWLLQKGKDALKGFYNGVTNAVTSVKTWFTGLKDKIKGWIGSTFTFLRKAGYDSVVGLYNGVISFVNETLKPWFNAVKDKILGWIGSALGWLSGVGSDIVSGLYNGITGAWGRLRDMVVDKVEGLKKLFTGPLGFLISSPSKLTTYYGDMIMAGLAKGIEKNYEAPANATKMATDQMAKAMLKGVKEAEAIANAMQSDIRPVITPILDLSNVRAGSKQLNSLVSGGSYSRAAVIAASPLGGSAAITGSGTSEIRFEQTINAPKQLSTSDIYRQTRNQITLAKEELSIP